MGKPNPLMMRSALNRIDAHSETTVMVGDRMDTDMIAGLEAGLRTVLVLTGSTKRATRWSVSPTARPRSSTRSRTCGAGRRVDDDEDEIVDFAADVRSHLNSEPFTPPGVAAIGRAPGFLPD